MLILYAAICPDSKKAAHTLLLRALEAHFRLKELPKTAFGPYGKPFFPDYPQIHFNLSHSGPYALCALSGGPVGVDIEEIRPRGARLPAYAFNPAERDWFEARGGGWENFYTLWTRKESWCKRAGESAARPKSVCPPLPGEAAGTLAVHSFAGEGWRAAVCTEQEERPEILWTDL